VADLMFYQHQRHYSYRQNFWRHLRY